VTKRQHRRFDLDLRRGVAGLLFGGLSPRSFAKLPESAQEATQRIARDRGGGADRLLEAQRATPRVEVEDRDNRTRAAHAGLPQPEPQLPAAQAEEHEAREELEAFDRAFFLQCQVNASLLTDEQIVEAIEEAERDEHDELVEAVELGKAFQARQRDASKSGYEAGWLRGFLEERHAPPFRPEHAALSSHLQAGVTSAREATEAVERELADVPWAATAREPGGVGRVIQPGNPHTVAENHAAQRPFVTSGDLEVR
jgi:hypothetical protein